MKTPMYQKIKVERAAVTGLPMVAIATVSQVMSRNHVSPNTIADFRNDAFLTDREMLEVIGEYVSLV